MSQLVELSDLANHLKVLTSKEYPLKWRICPFGCEDNEFEDMDEISPGEAVREIMKGRDLEIYLCNDEPDREPLIGLVFNNGVYLEYGFGGEGGVEDPIDDALVHIQTALYSLRTMSLSDDQVRDTWLKIFQAALDVNQV